MPRADHDTLTRLSVADTLELELIHQERVPIPHAHCDTPQWCRHLGAGVDIRRDKVCVKVCYKYPSFIGIGRSSALQVNRGIWVLVQLERL